MPGAQRGGKRDGGPGAGGRRHGRGEPSPHRRARPPRTSCCELLPDLPAIPSLPQRSPAERILAHGLVGVRGVMIDDAGDVRVDVDRLDPLAAIRLDPDHDAFGGLRGVPRRRGRAPRAREVAGGGPGHPRPGTHAAGRASQRWPSTSPIRAVREHLRTVRQWVADALPDCPQVVVIDEPGFSGVLEPGLPDPARHRHRPRVRRVGRHRADGDDGRALLRGRRPGGHRGDRARRSSPCP